MAKSTASATEEPAEQEAVKVSPKLQTAVQAWQSAVEKVEIAFDNIRKVAQSETVKNGYTEKQLTSMLLDLGLDPARASEVKGYVFPAHSAARKQLDKAMEINAAQTDAKKRVPKPVILALQRDKEGKLTLESALKAHKAAKKEKDGTPDKDSSKLTAEEIEEKLKNLVAAAVNFAKKHEYDESDFASVVEDQYSAIMKGKAEVTIDFEAATEDEDEDDKD